MEALPIDDVVAEILAAVRRSTPVVLKAPPGAGKTTGVPPALIEAGLGAGGQILLIQPRRLAARSAATRLANMIGSELGDRVGYHVRFDRKATQQTELVVMTTGILLRRLHSDPLLDNVTCVILDEFHERSLELDLALGMLQRVRTTFRDDLKLIVMSATLDPQPIVDFLGDATGIISEGRSFPVEIHYAKQHTRDRIEDQVAACLPRLVRATDGDVLVFLPGIGEIRRTGAAISGIAKSNHMQVLELYGDLSPSDQDRVLRRSDIRKIILSTNVAETSVTIPGVAAVIDSGLARVMAFDAKVGLPHLKLQPISNASANQRAGRAGRTRPGTCQRLWPEAMQRSRPDRDTPEILRSDLSSAVLTLATWGETDVRAFPWLSPPSHESVSQSKMLLRRLGAIDFNGQPTKVGQRMARMPLHPRMARLLIAAESEGVTHDATITAAMLTERDPFRGGPNFDLDQRLRMMNDFASGQSQTGLNEAAARQVLRVAKQLQRDIVSDSNTPTKAADRSIALSKSLLAAYPDRVAKRRQPGSDRGLMVGGRGIKMDRSTSSQSSELLLCLDVDAGDTDARVRTAVRVELDWLDQDHLRVVDETIFHPSRRAIVGRRRTYFVDLMIDEAPAELEPNEVTAAVLFDEAKRQWSHAFPIDDQSINDFLARVRFLAKHHPSSTLPTIDDETLEDLLREFCRSRTTLAEIKSAPWLDHLRGNFTYEQLQQIDRDAPQRITVPSGNSYAVDYVEVDTPTMSVKLQEVFGWTQTPQLAGGAVPLRLELLGPNRRPQQITADLTSFWATTYQQVRKDLRGRYPKHHWPEDPMAAKATRNGMKPK